MKASFERLPAEIGKLIGQRLSKSQLDLFIRHAELVAEGNTRINLTAITDPDEVRQKHFLDSLSCAAVMINTPINRVIDVGAGAGFPGIPLKVLYPEMQLTLVESVGKKAKFLEELVQELGLTGVEVLADRAERVGQDPAHREKYDWALGRAVAGLPTLMEYLLPLVRLQGRALAQRGEKAEEEAQKAADAIRLLGGKMAQVSPVTLPGVEGRRYLVVINKLQPTPGKYPRREGVPGKRPIGS